MKRVKSKTTSERRAKPKTQHRGKPQTPARKYPLVGLIMGSDSDWAIMKSAADQLEDFGIAFEKAIVSAHRTPNRMVEYADTAQKRGLQIIIAGAGGAAHLPGMVASLTPLPVIGVPVKTGSLEGLDALLSIAQMPKGVPVATVAVNNGANAALLAVRILALSDKQLALKLDEFIHNQTKTVEQKAELFDSL